MTKDPRPETKHEKFERLRDARLPKITHAMDLLGNLSGSGYESSDQERRTVIAELQAGVDAVAAKFGLAQAAATPEPVPKAVEPPTPEAKIGANADDAKPTDPAEGGGIAKHEILWAFDAVQRKDWKLAANRLKRVIDMWKGPS